jgi:uncharacterized protein (TIGR00255 family)
MTGYGQARHKANGYSVTVEVKSVNHRFLDINVRLLRRYMLLEEKIKDLMKGQVSRGHFDVNLSVTAEFSDTRLKVDKDLAMDYYNSLRELAEKLNISADFRIFDFVRVPDVFTLEHQAEDMDLIWQTVAAALQEAMRDLTDMRREEGAHLASDLQQRNQELLRHVVALEGRSPEVTRNYQQKLALRVGELSPGVDLDQQRLLQEVALFADRSSITEEIVRLKSHIGQFDVMLAQGEAIGRKCDFLLQEMFREINTIASKANDLVMSQIAVDVKAELEKIREQIQNIE